MQIPILSGSFTDEAADFRTSYPRNLVPVPKRQGISNGFLRPADGLVTFGTGPGADRGGIVWNGVAYRVMGTNLVRISDTGAVTVLGTVNGSGQVSFDYSFDRLIIAAGGALYYWSGALSQVGDPDLGVVVDAIWVDGYTMTTDGEFIIVTELNNPSAVNPLKYGSSEADPDPVKALLKLRNEPYALNRFTCEQFNNVGGNLFPFQRNDGAQLQRGTIGTHTCAIFMDALAFLGSGRNEPPAVWLGANGSTAPLSTAEIDTVLMTYTEAELAASVMETRVFKKHELLYIHLPDQCLVYDGGASEAVQEPVWYTLSSSVEGNSIYRARNILWCYGKWLCGDPTSATLGEIVDTVSTHYDEAIGWEFSTAIIYNESRGCILHQLELVALPGRVALGADPVVWTSYSVDGETWSAEESCPAGIQGDRAKRLTWLAQGWMENWRVQRFRGTSDARLSFARLEAQIEALNV
jgi:hypothetical protein